MKSWSRAQRHKLIGHVESSTQGTVTRAQLETRPVLRTGELLETVPGLVVTQHSGDGKANQYFLRGFNLDHGTDLATSVDGMPVNMHTHGHGQGYTDINFVIPELLDRIEYKKGTYYADEGNFSAAGAVDLQVSPQPRRHAAVAHGGRRLVMRARCSRARRISAAATCCSDSTMASPMARGTFPKTCAA